MQQNPRKFLIWTFFLRVLIVNIIAKINMKFNSINIINLLMAYFQVLNIEQTPINIKEHEIYEQFKMILLDLMETSNELYILMEETLDFQENFKNTNACIIEDIDLHSIPDYPEPPTDQCVEDYESFSFEYKQNAIEYWRGTKRKKNKSLESVQNKFKIVKSDRQLRRWAHQINQGGTYREKIARICEYTLDNFKAAIESNLIIHDNDLRRWALKAQKIIEHEDFRLKASKHWVLKFKHAHRIISRKINKFVSKKLEE